MRYALFYIIALFYAAVKQISALFEKLISALFEKLILDNN